MRNFMRLVSAPALLLVVLVVVLLFSNPIGFEQMVRAGYAGSLGAVSLANIFSPEPYLWPFEVVFNAKVLLATQGFISTLLVDGAAVLFILALACLGSVLSTFIHVCICPLLYGKYLPGYFWKHTKLTFLLNAIWVGALYGMAYVLMTNIHVQGLVTRMTEERWDGLIGEAHVFFGVFSAILLFFVWVAQHVYNSAACGVKLCKETVSPDSSETSDPREQFSGTHEGATQDP